MDRIKVIVTLVVLEFAIICAKYFRVFTNNYTLNELLGLAGAVPLHRSEITLLSFLFRFGHF